jgi:hypothetical protein
MNFDWHVVSLVLASITGWTLLAFGSLPVAVLRQHGREPLMAAGAWGVVAALASSAIFHWYLIFAIICLVAWTKLNRLGGKFWLATAAALGLSLGIVFPLEISPPLLLRENPFVLASLYLGGAATGLAYAVFATSVRSPVDAWRPRGFAKGLLIVSIAWIAFLAARPWWLQRIVPLEAVSSEAMLDVRVMILFGLGLVLLLLALFIMAAVRRNAPGQARVMAGAAAVTALAEMLVTQFVFR